MRSRLPCRRPERLLHVLVDAYGRNLHRLLADLARLLEVSVAYVDRPTIEAHLERTLSDREWIAVADQLFPLAFDEHVGEGGSIRTDWIDDVLAGGVAGGTVADTPPPVAFRRRRSCA